MILDRENEAHSETSRLFQILSELRIFRDPQKISSGKHFLSYYIIRCQYRRSGDQPGNRIDDHQDSEIRKYSADGIDPDQTKETGSKYGKHSRRHRISYAPQRRPSDLIGAGERDERQHIKHTNHREARHIRIGSKQRYKKTLCLRGKSDSFLL